MLNFESIIQAVVDFSRIDIKLVRITEPQNDSFLFSIDAQVYRTGPVFATMSAMTIDLAGPAGRYGQLQLPEIKITPTETKISIRDQKIQITDMDAFLGLTAALVSGEKATLSLENGAAQVKIMGFKFSVKFNKTCEMLGMKGPRTEFIKAKDETGSTVLAKIYNPSPLEIDLGIATFECRNVEGRVLARQQGKIFITRGESVHEVSMTVTMADDMDGVGDISKLQMVGIDSRLEGFEGTWMKETIRKYCVDLALTPALEELVRRKEKEVLDGRRAGG